MDSAGASLWDLTAAAGSHPGRFLADAHAHIAVRDLAGRTCLDAEPETFRNKSVLIATSSQVLTALAAFELDGIARRIVLCSPGLPAPHLQSILRDACIETILSDAAAMPEADGLESVRCSDSLRVSDAGPPRSLASEWVLLTSGTTGAPKLVMHVLASLTRLPEAASPNSAPVWGAFYDIRRYGGLQILLRALTGGGSMLLSSAGEPVPDFLARAGAAGVTHLSGTPSHWRSALASGAATRIAPRYVRVGGEICDQPILDRLRAAFPAAHVTHAFASTEAGVAFDVHDGLAGFPAAMMQQTGPVRMKIEAGSLRIRSARTARRYLGKRAPALLDEDDFVDTADLVERRGDRYYFVGRRDGVINVGGLKVHPEAVEAVINRHPAIDQCRVTGRASPILGALIVAEFVLKAPAMSEAAITDELLGLCRTELPAHAVPATLRAVQSLEISHAGKLIRR